MPVESSERDVQKTSQLLKLASDISRLKSQQKFLYFEPIPKQAIACNSRKGMVMVAGANRVGKTKVAAFILTCHLTGVYPDWWTGPRYKRPVDIGVVGKTNRAVRDVMQKNLLGPLYDLGTGMVPKDYFARPPSRQQGIPDLIDTAFVKHASGGVSTVKFFSCQMDVGVIMGQDWDMVAFDEEPSPEWYRQARMRIVSRSGLMLLTFTPEDGWTEIVTELYELDEDLIERITITVDDAPYYPKKEREKLERELSDWEKEFRLYGRPSMGEAGKVFRHPESNYVIDSMDPEPHWRRVGGLDVGYGHATCALDVYIDDSTPEATFYVLREYFSKEELPDVHAAKLRAWGDIDFYIDPSSKKRAPTDGNNLFTMYENRGLSLFMANNDVDASILFINQLFNNRQLFISKDCPNLIEQIAMYRRVVEKKTNRAVILKRNDDAIDPLRYALMANETARVPNRRKPQPWEVTQKVNLVQWKPFNAKVGY